MGGRGAVFESKGYSTKIKNIEDEISGEKIETAVLLDSKGNTIFTETSGATNYVQFTEEQLAQMKGANLTHNHPGSNTFSKPDIDLLVAHELNSIRATCAERTYVLSLSRGKTGDKSFGSDFQKACGQNQQITDIKWNSYITQYNNGFITSTEIQSLAKELNKELNSLNSEWLKENAKNYGYKYNVIERRK